MKNNLNNIPEGWNSLDSTPPDTFVEVVDKDGITAFAQPTYYPFKVEKREGDEGKMYGWRGTVVHHEDGVARWDGGWMIAATLKMDRNIGTIIAWRNRK